MRAGVPRPGLGHSQEDECSWSLLTDDKQQLISTLADQQRNKWATQSFLQLLIASPLPSRGVGRGRSGAIFQAIQ